MMCIEVPRLSDTAVSSLAKQIEDDGFGVLPGFVSAAALARLRGFVADAVKGCDGYVGFVGPAGVGGSGLDELGQSKPFKDLVERLYQHGTGRRPPAADFYQVLRCLTGGDVQKHSYLFHYDSYVVTVLLPIEIPQSGKAGDLLMLPNMRNIRSLYVSNVIDKIILDNPLAQRVLKWLTLRGLRKVVRIKMVPGNAYFFWGYRSVHANEPCDPDKLRATALFHYANPHANRRSLQGLLRRHAPVGATAGAGEAARPSPVTATRY